MTTLDLSMCYQDLGLTEPPFRLTPDTDFFFPGSHHMEALNHLHFGIASGGFTMLTGEVGLGENALVPSSASASARRGSLRLFIKSGSVVW